MAAKAKKGGVKRRQMCCKSETGERKKFTASTLTVCFYHLEAPIERVTGFDTPYPHSLEWAYFPGPVRIGEAVDRLMKA